MRVLIVSDTHRDNDNYFKVIEKIKDIDMVIHCGDAEGSEYAISEAAGCETHIVLGNNDFFSDLPREKEFYLGKYKVWLTHGHNFYVSMDNATIKKEAKGRGVDIVMYGHSHRPVVEIEKDIIAINPGSLTYPRQEGRKPSYIIMELDRQGMAHFTINYIE
jgi:putative phosphoesterase